MIISLIKTRSARHDLSRRPGDYEYAELRVENEIKQFSTIVRIPRDASKKEVLFQLAALMRGIQENL